MAPKVSIIVPIYGVERYIERCAVSLFEQTYPNVEYVFVNDATQDKSIDILLEVMSRYPMRQKDVHIITHPKNRGISATRNTGLKAVQGDYIFYADSDDFMNLYAIEKLVQCAEESKADIVLFDTNVVEVNGVRYESVQWRGKENYIKGLLQHTEKCAHWNKFYNAKFYLNTGVLADERIRLADDYAVTPRVVHQAQNISVLHEPLYFYETTNQTSHVHQYSRAAIESQYVADGVLIDYFSHVADAAVYADVISVLPQRSMVSLLKNTGRDGWMQIREVYKDDLAYSSRNMTIVNRIIFHLFKNQQYNLLSYFMKLYHCIC